MASRLLLLLLATLPLLLVAAAAGQNKILRPLTLSCSKTDNYTDGSQYKKNLDQLLAALPAAAGDKGWSYNYNYNGSAGAGSEPDAVFVLIMCLAYSSTTQCHDCLSGAPAGITTVCPGSRNVTAAYDACELQYSSAPVHLRYSSSTADLGDVFACWISLLGFWSYLLLVVFY